MFLMVVDLHARSSLRLRSGFAQDDARFELDGQDPNCTATARFSIGYERFYRFSSRSAATNRKNTTEITPFMVKNAALSLERSSARTRECS